VLFAIGFCHLLNDMMQSLLPAILYPTLKAQISISASAQIGLVTMAFQCTRLAVAAGGGDNLSDLRPRPYSLAVGMVSTLVGAAGAGGGAELIR